MGDKVVSIAGRGSEYELATEELRRRFEAEACILIVLSGSKGTGVSVSMPEDLRAHMPKLFRDIAKEWEDALITERSAFRCPVCRAGLSFESRPRHQINEPQPGALTVCAQCASFLKFDESETWRLVSQEELAEMPDEVRIALTRTRRNIERRRNS